MAYIYIILILILFLILIPILILLPILILILILMLMYFFSCTGNCSFMQPHGCHFSLELSLQVASTRPPASFHVSWCSLMMLRRPPASPPAQMDLPQVHLPQVHLAQYAQTSASWPQIKTCTNIKNNVKIMKISINM